MDTKSENKLFKRLCEAFPDFGAMTAETETGSLRLAFTLDLDETQKQQLEQLMTEVGAVYRIKTPNGTGPLLGLEQR
jgi:hypothetical protein